MRKTYKTWRWSAVAVLWAALLGPAAAMRAAEPVAADGKAYRVTQLLLDFGEDLPVHPPVRALMQLEVPLTETAQGWVAPRGGAATVGVKLSEIPKLKQSLFHASALAAIGQAISSNFAEWGYTGVVVAPHSADIGADAADQRVENQTALRLVARSAAGRGVPQRQRGPVWGGVAEEDGRPHAVSQIIFEISRDLDKGPGVSDLLAVSMVLGQTDEGLVAPRMGIKNVQIRAADLPQLKGAVLYDSGLHAMLDALNAYLRGKGFDKLHADLHPKDITAEGKDTRFENQTALRVLVHAGPPLARAQLTRPGPQIVQTQPSGGAVAKVEAKDGQAYPVSQVIVEYAQDRPGLPSLASVMQTEVSLLEVEDGYVAPRDGQGSVKLRLVDIPHLPKGKLYGSAVRHLNQKLVEAFNQRGYIGILVAPHPADLDEQTLADARPAGQTAMRLEVRAGVVTGVRTLASGERVATEARVDSPAHQRIVEQSPVKPDEGHDLLRKDLLDEYVERLNRHPGRRVDVAVSGSEQPGGVNLDYLVTENKPWVVYAQVSNTGTKETSDWRERFGFTHYQLTGRDDIFSLDYITANFSEAHTVSASYERPLLDSQRVRWRASGSWSQFTASDVGFAGEDFKGDEWSAGLDLIINFFQHRGSFVDLVVGARWLSVHVENEILMEDGRADFFLPHVGLQYERITDTATSLASVMFEANAPSIANTDSDELDQLGRLDPDADLMALKWNITQTFFLEPLLNRAAWEDPSTPGSSTLAHEVLLAFKGQYGFGKRLIPQLEQTAGGLYSVRGYPESMVAGDTALLGTVEYRLHIPRLLAVRSEPGKGLFGETFRWAPQQVYGRPDWDLIVRGFFDVGMTAISDPLVIESDHTLMSAGVGLELQMGRNFNARLDWGTVLKEVAGFADEGDSRLHLVFTILY